MASSRPLATGDGESEPRELSCACEAGFCGAGAKIAPFPLACDGLSKACCADEIGRAHV